MRATSLAYRPAIDGLRAVAVSLVIAAHVAPHFVVGRIGVDIFFVISGYLIATILTDELDRHGRIGLSAFYVRRALRLGPPLVALLVAYLATCWLWRGGGASRSDLLMAALAGATYTWNVLILAVDGIPHHAGFGLAHLWSLAQEEQFYLVLPLALVVAGASSLRSRRALVLVLVLLALAVALYVWTAPSIFSEFSPLTRGAGLFGGVAVALHRRRPRTHRVPEWLAWSSVVTAVAVVVGVQSGGLPPWVDVPLAVLCGMVLVAHLAEPEAGAGLSHLLSTKPLVGLGLVSYALYLWHLPLIVICLDVLHFDRLQTAISAVPVALALAVATRLWVERPAHAVRVRYDQTRARRLRKSSGKARVESSLEA